jgi:nucleoside-diphosphate-sugar epimerase
VPELLGLGHDVRVFDNFLYTQASLNHCVSNQRFHVEKGDIRDVSKIKEHYEWADVIIPLAALVGAPLCNFNPVGSSTINKEAIYSMLKVISKGQLVIMPTTNSAYGNAGGKGFCDETSDLSPVSKYAKEKVQVEEELMGHPAAISLRLATVFGMSPRMRIDLLVNDFTHRACVDGFIVLFESHFKRNYVHVRDVANAFIFAIENSDKMQGEIYNLGLSDTNISKLELCNRIKKCLPEFTILESQVGRDPDQRDYVVSNKKIESLGYKTKHSLDQGIKELIKGYTMLKNRRYGNI